MVEPSRKVTAFPKRRSLVFATNAKRALHAFRSIVAPEFEVLSLADIALPEPVLKGRDARQSAMAIASLVSLHARLPTVASVRSFSINPLLAYDANPDPHQVPSGDPTWTWQIPSRQSASFVEAVIQANQTLLDGGYCGPSDRGAFLLTTLCFITPDGDPQFFEGWCGGQFYLPLDVSIATGIDFDDCLEPTGFSATLARLDTETQAQLSDLRKATQSLKIRLQHSW